MDREIVDTVTGWESTPLSGGYEGLRGLADREFSGAVTAGSAWGFMLNGRLIAIREGSLSAFETTDGTAYESPDPALPLLYAMYGRGEKQAEYYSNEKSISEADATLTSGSFTGYIELSENVLSGDYYTVYYGGKSMSAAFVGNSKRLLTGDEAFERADDEVGIYTVYAADLDVIDIPEAEDATDDEPSADDSADEDNEGPTAGRSAHDQPTADRGVTPEPTDTGGSGDTNDSATTDTDPSTADPADDAGSVTPTPSGSTAGGRSTDSDTSTATGGADRAASTDSEASATKPRPESGTAANGTGGPQAATARSTADGSSDDVFSSEAEWRNTKTIPSLDPSSDSADDRTESTTRSQSTGRQQSASGSQLSRTQLKKRLKRAEKVMDKAEERHEALIEERDAAITERDAAREELDDVREELSAARAEVDRLEAKLQSADAGGGSTAGGSDAAAGRSLSTTEALEGTNLLVRYASKSDGTLEDAAAGESTQADVRSNIRIEPHTTFDTEGASVDGTPFETFLDGRIELAFVRWLAEEFLFDIQETGNRNDLSAIYETIPAINRAELRGSVDLGTDEEGDTLSAQFDVVVRDKRDRPLFVAEFNESKQPVGGGMIESLVRDGSEIVARDDSFAAAFGVTTSYYKGAALDAAANATGGGFLSASRGKSFVYISRKQGFHLCLVERLGDTFDLHVPEL
ncbi:DUF7527 domain-containing protein [Halohasta salina]|uniref:DUF7527 domain-containing protein n=1 Tax=Halohasta salina TaxID=2961621 RepID=UPI0020A3BEDF|nr:hypothetical protein [Halohasta salina]